MIKEWENEPDRKQWIAHDLDCLILRNSRVGHLCGYVGIPKSHPFFGKDTNDIYEFDNDPDVHGGITFSSEFRDKTICKPVANEKVWWLGFDCAHYGDLMPFVDLELQKHMPARGFNGDIYRNMDYVTKETEYLAKQLSSEPTHSRS